MPSIACTSLETVSGGPVRGVAASSGIQDGVLSWEGDTITYAGPRERWSGEPDEVLAGSTVVPGFVDCHTHLPFAGWRDDEYEARLRGSNYRDLHGSGGIPRSARMLAEASDDEVIAFCRPLLAEMLEHGTTALEMKTGYGLSVEAELRQARLARRLADEVPQTVTVTLLAGHAVPPGIERDAWVRTACDELIPAAAAEGLVDAVDVYVEDIAFTVEHLREIAHAGLSAGLAVRCHADQLGSSNAAEVAAALGARSADHLNHIGDAGVAAMGRGETAAVLLPASTLMLRSSAPPATRLLDAGALVALATDCNPGTSPVVSMPEVISLGCALYGLDPSTALAASTANPAWVLGLHERLGTLEPGKRADFVVLEGEAFRMVPYRPGHDPVRRVVVGGRTVYPNPPGVAP